MNSSNLNKLFAEHWYEYSIPDTKLGRRLYKNQIVRIEYGKIILRKAAEPVILGLEEGFSYKGKKLEGGLNIIEKVKK